MRRTPLTALLAALLGTLIGSCSSDSSLFNEGNGPTGGTSTTTGTTTGTSTGTNTGTGTTPTGAGGGTTTPTGAGGQGATGAGGTGASGATGGVGGAPNTCAHPLCEWGDALVPGCSDCVMQVCASDAFCCANSWDNYCIDAVLALCGIDCGGGLPTCDDQYGNVANYTFCLEQPATCEFQTGTIGTSCSQLCQIRGGECFYAFNDNGTCTHGQQLSCDTTGFQSLICVCSRGCGGNPPCANNQVCDEGSCQ